jgi:alanyl-tRNA synthetase
MPTDKEIKKEFKKKASQEPDKYYATSVLKKEGFVRKKCKCGTYFWTASDSNTCGDPSCSGGFRFIGDSPAKKELDYIEVWKEFARLFEKWGYKAIKRYPVVARWRDDTDFVQASIYDFQPWVVSGTVSPPANPLVVPQFCLRFNDIDNVGITGAHYTGFVMIGQHAFMKPSDWNQEKYFTDIHNWLKKGLGLPNEEVTFHEDAWAGGGNFGPCMEYFCRGLELGNQVYMMYEQTPSGNKELNLKVLDMGMGHERNAWFTKATSTSYESVFPTVCKKLYSATGIKVDDSLMKRFLPYSSYLNIDEVEDIDKTWVSVADKVGEDVKTLKEKILPLAALYSIGEHSRSLLVALSDGALPSNVGGGYNLRAILRRALSFIDKYSWNIDLADVCKWHAEYLKPLFPELMKHLDEVNEILSVEKDKYEQTKQKSHQLVKRFIKEKIDNKKLLQLYDSQGINPEIIKEEAAKLGKTIEVPENFYAKVAELHEKSEQVHATVKEEKLALEKVPDTKALYFDDYSKLSSKARVLKVIDKNVVLDQTVAYPTSGGQLHDLGEISGSKIVDVFKQGSVIVHVLAEKPKFKEGDSVEIKIDEARRKQLAQHHTATHIVNAAAKRVLGSHINQAGAKKTEEKAHLDVTHFRNISEEELEKINKEANKIVKDAIHVRSSFMSRDSAEKKYGMGLYQGGAVPGKEIRVIEIPEIDVEACGGTHLKNTQEAGEIKIIKSSKIQDGIVRITFTSGKAAQKEEAKEEGILDETARLLNVEIAQVPARAEELFDKWKKARKAVKKGKSIDAKELELKSTQKYEGDVLAKTAEILRTQPEVINKTISRFLKELEEFKEKLK